MHLQRHSTEYDLIAWPASRCVVQEAQPQEVGGQQKPQTDTPRHRHGGREMEQDAAAAAEEIGMGVGWVTEEGARKFSWRRRDGWLGPRSPEKQRTLEAGTLGGVRGRKRAKLRELEWE